MQRNIAAAAASSLFAAALILLAAALWSPAPRAAAAQEAAAVSFLVLDMQSVLRNSTAIRSLEERLRAREENGIEIFTQREQALLAESRELQSQQDVLSPEAFDERIASINERGEQLSQEADTYAQSLQRFLREGVQEVQDKVFELTETVAAERGADAVASKDSMFLLNKELEITSLILEQINAALETTETEARLAQLPTP